MKVYQSFLRNEQRSLLSSAATPFDAQGHAGRNDREYELLKEIASGRSTADREPWGLVSWKFQQKSLVSVEDFIAFSERKLALGFDCVFINPMIGNEALYYNVWEQGIDQGHRGLDTIHAFLSRHMSHHVSAAMGRRCFAFCNYFVAWPRFWNDYFAFVDDAIARLDEEAAGKSEVGLIYRGSANYARDPALSMRPFVIERLFSSFLAGSASFKCEGFEYPRGHFQRKFGEVLGDFLERLSALKNRALDSGDRAALDDWRRRRSVVLQSGFKAAIWQLDDPPFFLAGARDSSRNSS